MKSAWGQQKRIVVGNAGSPLAQYQGVEFFQESLAQTSTLLNTNGLTGDRGHTSARTRIARIDVGGQLLIPASAPALWQWLPRCMGLQTSATIIDLAALLPKFELWMDRSDQVDRYRSCTIDRAILGGSTSQPLVLQLEIIGVDEVTDAVSSFPVAAAASSALPYLFSDLRLLIDDDPVAVEQFELTIDNRLRPRFVNSRTATSIDATDRAVQFSFTQRAVANGLALDALNWPGSAVELRLNDGETETGFMLGAFQNVALSPHVDRTGQPFHVATGEGVATSVAPALRVTQTDVG